VSNAIQLQNLGKMYKLFRHPSDKVVDAFGLGRWTFWRKMEYREFWALRSLNLEVRQGERVGIIGQNGAGKSTLLKIISGNITPTEGTVDVAGRIQALLELGTGFHPEFTGRENIRASLALNGMSATQIRDKMEEIVDFAELEDFIDQPLKTYSAGMYARLAFSTATVISPEILIIDEVLGAGDAYFAGKCVERMKRLTHESGATVLFVSHDLGSVQALCDRVIWIHRGVVRMDGEPLDVIKEYTAMVRKEEEARMRARDLKVMKKQAVLLDRNEDIYDRIILHLIGADGVAPEVGQRVYCLKLHAGDQEVARIDVGDPMDNSADHQNYIMDEPGFMDWSRSKKDQRGTYREYINLKGRYNHAPFEFAIPKTYTQDAGRPPLRLDIAGAFYQGNIAVEAWNGEGYVRLGLCDPSREEQSFKIPWSILRPGEAEGAAAEPRESGKAPVHPKRAVEIKSGEYGGGGAKITAVRMYNGRGEETRSFQVGDSIRVVLEYEAFEDLLNPVFVFCAYLPDGKCATQWIAASEQMGHSRVSGKGTVTFHVEQLALGRSAYVASVAIFKFLRADGREPESYHVLDRAIHFQVLQDLGVAYEMGLCVQPVRAELGNG
jgi:lipopolysaccharide transport system ATP-binding protein